MARIAVPIIVLFCKVGTDMSFFNVYQGSFNENYIFPFYKRVTTIGVCQFIARCITIGAFLIAELPRPIPSIVLLVLNGFAFICIFFLPEHPTDDKAIEDNDGKKKDE